MNLGGNAGKRGENAGNQVGIAGKLGENAGNLTEIRKNKMKVYKIQFSFFCRNFKKAKLELQ